MSWLNCLKSSPRLLRRRRESEMFASNPNNLPRVGDEPEHSYLGSAADLMIGLLFVFIIMVAFLAIQRRGEQDARLAEQAAKEALVDQAAEEIRASINRDPRGVVTAAIGDEIRKNLPSVRVDPSSGVITLPEELLFDLGRSDLKPTAIETLSKTSKQLAEVLDCFVASQMNNKVCPNNPRQHQIETIFIEGHTDSIPMNRDGGNIKLSLERAISVHKVLVQRTPLAAFRNNNEQPIFSYSAYGEARPLITDDTTDARNRRVDLRIVLTYKPVDPDDLVESFLQRSIGN